MNKKLKKIIAAVSAVSAISIFGMNVSAATADDVIGAAYGAGISDQYVQTLIGFLSSHEYTPEQYDMMLNAIYNIEGIGDDIIKDYTGGLTLDDLRGESGSDSTEPTENKEPATDSGNKDTNSSSQTTKPSQNGIGSAENNGIASPNNWKDIIKDNMTNEQMLAAINEMVSVGKEIGYDITVEKKGDKNFLVTVKDKDGNIQMVTPVGQVIERTGGYSQNPSALSGSDGSNLNGTIEGNRFAAPTVQPLTANLKPLSILTIGGIILVVCAAGVLIFIKKDKTGE